MPAFESMMFVSEINIVIHYSKFQTNFKNAEKGTLEVFSHDLRSMFRAFRDTGYLLYILRDTGILRIFM